MNEYAYNNNTEAGTLYGRSRNMTLVNLLSQFSERPNSGYDSDESEDENAGVLYNININFNRLSSNRMSGMTNIRAAAENINTELEKLPESAGAREIYSAYRRVARSYVSINPVLARGILSAGLEKARELNAGFKPYKKAKKSRKGRRHGRKTHRRRA
jgi:hypothetical protein